MTHLRIETEDELYLEEQEIHAIINGQEYIYSLDVIEKIVMLTTDLGPFYDDMGLAIDVGNETAVFIMSEHECFQPFLFEQIGKVLPIDFQKVIDASMCKDNNVFEIYRKDPL